ncbi:MAG TPA: gliding motility lipoprotein GldH [Perlabentimonas sp.]|jgi:gliding motility-associated lipoprotein GldH|nr:gliding motility lipoprotein GldH [Bacteroidales bacterium]MDD4671657.1 gliding motility lipoprotein GldH [Bacteroidales bacterium]MDY0349276.1 gliding motility lipoprotein GldH [Tenuifilaceae bacterium]HZJ74552.1 gliding motility lipoprotein GldH [Perlabentimonas sp.]
MKNKLLGIAFGIAILAAACGKVSVYNKSVDIPREKWSMDSLAVFKVDISDTLSIYDVYVNLRNTTTYANSNLFLFIETRSPSGAKLRDTLECMLADPYGRWLGKGFGALRDNQIPYKRYVRFPEVGVYQFTIQHGMRTQSLKGIASVGIKVEQH